MLSEINFGKRPKVAAARGSSAQSFPEGPPRQSWFLLEARSSNGQMRANALLKSSQRKEIATREI